MADSKFRKRDKDTQGIGNGILAGAFGLLGELPFVGTATQIDKLFDPKERGQYLGEMAKQVVVPGLVSQIAAFQDKNSQGQPIKRKPETIGEHIKTGIPGLRETVKKKPGQAP